MPKPPAVLYPAFLDLRGVSVMVVGGGAVALRKARALVASGAKVTAVAPSFEAGFGKLRKAAKRKRAFRAADVHGARLVFAATDNEALNRRIAALAKKQGAWVNVAAPPEAGDFAVPSSLRSGSVCVAVSTGGASAAAAKALREKLDAAIDPAWGAYVALLERRRAKIKKIVADPQRRRMLLQDLGDAHWVQIVKTRGRAEAARRMDAAIRNAARVPGNGT